MLGGVVSMGLSGCDREDPAALAANPRAIEGAIVLGSAGTAPGRFSTPRCIAEDGQTIWVIDRTARIQRLDPKTGRCIQWFTTPDWELGKPTGMAIGPAPAGDGARAIYVADTHYSRLLVYALPDLPAKWTPNSTDHAAEQVTPTMLGQVGTHGSGAGEFIYPSCVAVLTTADGRGVDRIYVGEFGGNDRVQIFDRTLKQVGSFGSLGAGDRPTEIQFNRPQGLQIDAKRGEVIVADSINNRLGRFTLDGHLKGWIGSPEHPGREAGRFFHPRGMFEMPDGTLLVTEFGNNRIQRIDPSNGRSLGVWGKAGGKPGELAEPWAMTVLDGRVYVVEGRNNRITSFVVPG